MSDKEQLDRIENKLNSILLLLSGKASIPVAQAGGAPRAVGGVSPAPGGGGAVASDDELDSTYGDPVVRKDPGRWRGESMSGRKFSQCTPEYLEELAGLFDWRGDQDDKSNAVDAKGNPKSKWSRLDAARARGWARRLRQSGGGDGGAFDPSMGQGLNTAARSWENRGGSGHTPAPAQADEASFDADEVPFLAAVGAGGGAEGEPRGRRGEPRGSRRGGDIKRRPRAPCLQRGAAQAKSLG
jgi:hypothetical protein